MPSDDHCHININSGEKMVDQISLRPEITKIEKINSN